MPGWFWKLPFVWRFKYNYYHEQFVTPISTEEAKKTLPYVKYDAHEDGDIVWNPYAGGHFRCPYCGQAHELRFTFEAEDLRLKQNPTMDTVWLERIRNGVTERFNEDEREYDHYVHALANMIKIPCHHCHETAPKWRWTHAYQNPLLYFETENICHCGGEMYYQGSPGTDRFGLICEKCNWIKPGSAISGAERME